MHGHLTAVASLVGHRLYSTGSSVIVVQKLSCSSVWNLPPLAGRFSTAEPPGKLDLPDFRICSSTKPGSYVLCLGYVIG